LASLRHPVFGDCLYGAPVAPGFHRFFLHAHRLRFLSPSTGKPILIESSLPAELSSLLDSLRRTR
jgi:23S rRNA-/tRNA-specific pseudouridylate synthase